MWHWRDFISFLKHNFDGIYIYMVYTHVYIETCIYTHTYVYIYFYRVQLTNKILPKTI